MSNIPTNEECVDLFTESFSGGILAGCPLEALPITTYSADEYKEVRQVRNMHATPRWGRTKDVVKFVTGSKSEKQQYTAGLYMASNIAWAVFCMWFIVVLYAKCLKTFGFFSGVPMENPSLMRELKKKEQEKEGLLSDHGEGKSLVESASPAQSVQTSNKTDVFPLGKEGETDGEQENDQADGSSPEEASSSFLGGEPQDQRDAIRNQGVAISRDDGFVEEEAAPDGELERLIQIWPGSQRRLRNIRIAVFISAPLAWLFSILLMAYAFPRLHELLIEAKFIVPPLLDVMEDARLETVRYLNASDELMTSRIDLVNGLVDRCELDQLVEVNNTNVTIKDIVVFFNETLENGTMVRSLVSQVNETFYNISKSMEGINMILDTADDFWYFIAGGFIIFIDLLIVSFLVGTVLSWIGRQPRRLRQINNWVILPIFCAWLLAAYLISTYALIFAQFTADFCIDSPDETVTRMIGAPFPFSEFVDWYVGGCSIQDDPKYLKVFAKVLSDYFKEVEASIAPSFYSGIWTQACEAGQADIIADSLHVFLKQLNNVLLLTLGLVDAVACVTFNPIYTAVAYEMACKSGIEAAAYTFVFLFLFAIFAIIIVTLRASWWPIKDEEGTEEMPMIDNEQTYGGNRKPIQEDHQETDEHEA